VVVEAQPDAVQASQQLGSTPTQPPTARHRVASRLVLHFVTPFLVMQHVTRPGRPQIDFDAHLTMVLSHSGRSCWLRVARAAMPRAHRTYSLCVAAVVQSHRKFTAARTVAMASASVTSSPHRSP
jgi:hypothetical protein